jgi:pimeloyl-ACP methyl ester carboxylesterase
MAELTHRIIKTNGIQMHIAEQGSGPLVLFCHGFPESWYSWRHQLKALSEAGFHAVAPDMRGYGETEQPRAIDQYTLLHLVGDMAGVLDALGEQTAVIVGHDWGAPVAWHSALLRPDRFRAVVGLSVPYRGRGPVRPTTVMPQTESALFYQLYFQEPGVAEAELDRDPKTSIRRLLFGASGDAPRGSGGAWEAGARVGMVDRKAGLLGSIADPAQLPAWLTSDDLEYYAGRFAMSGFRGGLNWYRNVDRSWELLAPFAGAKVTVPALYIVGERDVVVAFPGMEQTLANLKTAVPQLRKQVMLPGCGHWTQQERSAEVNANLVEFVRSL